MSNTRNNTWRPTKGFQPLIPPALPANIERAFRVTTVAGDVRITGMVRATSKARAAVLAMQKHRDAGNLPNNITVVTDGVEAI